MRSGDHRVERACAPTESMPRTSRKSKALAIVLTAVLAIGGLLGTAQAAAAAPDVTHPGAISGLTVENARGGDRIAQWDQARISGNWSIPEGARAGETFGMTLPAEFTRLGSGTFEITDPATGQVLATCQVGAGSGPDMVCTLTEAVEKFDGVNGTFWLEATASRATEETTVEFDLGGRIEIVELPGEGGITPEDLTEPENPYKYGHPTAVDGRLAWTVGIPSSAVRDGGFTVRDALDRGQENHRYTGEMVLLQRPVQNGVLVDNWTRVSPDRYQTVFADDGQSFEFTASGLPASGYSYRLHYFTEADGAVLTGDTFGNNAVVNTTRTSTTVTVTESGGGDGSGAAYTRFLIIKELSGEQADAARDATFTVRYAVKGSDDPARTMSVPVGQQVRSDRAPLGSTFVIEEIDLPVIEGVEWGPWSLAGDGVVQTAEGVYEVTPGTTAGVELTLTNEANPVVPVTGSLSWTKVDGPGKALAGSEWTLTGPEGTTIAVVDDGERDEDPTAGALSVSGLAPGTYTLAETKAPEGYVRTDRTFTATIDGDHLAVSFGQIVNEKTSPPVPPTVPPPTTPVMPPGGLAVTGGEGAPALSVIALALLIAGGAAGLVSRRRSAASEN